MLRQTLSLSAWAAAEGPKSTKLFPDGRRQCIGSSILDIPPGLGVAAVEGILTADPLDCLVHRAWLVLVEVEAWVMGPIAPQEEVREWGGLFLWKRETAISYNP